MLRTEPKMKVCEGCGSMFMPRASFARACRLVCARKVVAKDKKSEKDALKARKTKQETIPELIKAAQKAFNDFIRERDREKPCICCGVPLGHHSGSTGGAFDCGHYRSRGAAGHLRFNEDNAHGQRKYCNRRKSGNAVEYRIGLIARIGEARVLALEADNVPHKWTHDELRKIQGTYKDKLKALKKAGDDAQ